MNAMLLQAALSLEGTPTANGVSTTLIVVALFGVVAGALLMWWMHGDCACEDCRELQQRVDAAEKDAKETRRRLAMTGAALVDAKASLAIYRAPAERVRSIMHDLKHGFRDEDLPSWFIVGTTSNPILTPFNDSARYSEISEFVGGAGPSTEERE